MSTLLPDPRPANSQKLKRQRWPSLIGWSMAVVTIPLIGMFVLLELIAHRPSPVHVTLTAGEIDAENARLKRLGLMFSGTLLKERPFEPPWTSHSLLIPSSWWQRPTIINFFLGADHVRADLLLSDLDVLEPVMRRAYGGWDSAAARGWNWDKWFADWRKQLIARGTTEISFNEAFAPISALIAFQRDNHTQIPLTRRSTIDGSQTALLANPPSADCVQIFASGGVFSISSNDAGQQVRTAKLWKSDTPSFAFTNYISMPLSYGTPQAVQCGDRRIGLEPIRSPMFAGRQGRARIERLNDSVAYARLPTFMPSNYEELSRDDWAQRRPGDNVLIVDLRNNDGGAWNYGAQALKGWIDGERLVPFERFGKQLNSSCLYVPLRWNSSIQNTPTISAGDKRFLQGLLDRIAQPYPVGCPRMVETRPAQWAYSQRHFDPKPGDLRIVALVNSRCGSDCELFTAMLASLRETIVVGTNTFGVGQFIQPGYSVLPHTGLNYRIALGRSDFYGDNRSFDGYGFDVDVVLPEVDKLEAKQLLQLAAIVAKL